MDLRLLWTKSWLGKDAPCANQAAASEGGPAKQLQERPLAPQSASSLIHPNEVNPGRHFHLQHFPRESNEVSSSRSILYSASSLSVHLNQKGGLKKRGFLLLKVLIRFGAGKNTLLNTGMFMLWTAGVHSP